MYAIWQTIELCSLEMRKNVTECTPIEVYNASINHCIHAYRMCSIELCCNTPDYYKSLSHDFLEQLAYMIWSKMKFSACLLKTLCTCKPFSVRIIVYPVIN